ncbi:dynamin family protein [Paenibacillus alkalitolerans]|uniref:dynamin family protein n=1 Tax=Paenibacillus alkalitolerans TaxID=2799335 RepID=UPI0018F75E21|nr:dynamin family protein [Paenibacillus alkalitolerans]
MIEREKVQQELERLRQNLEEAGDAAAAEKAGALAEKCREGTFYAALCGHFSAGKSSLINRLCGAALLPSSPIPTSANVVAIRNGPSEAVIAYRDGTTACVGIEEVPRYAKNGQEVESVELFHPIRFLGERAALLDTPGVDSTDDAHQMATESALHLADIVMYVMDYNHVLSEMNMEFAKRLIDLGKPLVLIVNQIDKHREEEVSFEDFRSGVDEAFGSWGVRPVATFYTTLKAPEHPHNEIVVLRSWLRETVRGGEALAVRGAAAAALRLTVEHGEFLAAANEPRKAELRELIAADEADSYAERYESIRGDLRRREDNRESAAEKVKAEARRIAENANLTPATTRDLAQSFLESRQPGFKVGLFFSGAKTEEERKRRLDAFYAEFRENVTARLVWHVRDLLGKVAEELGVAGTDEAQRAIEGVDAELSPEWLAAMVRPGAVVSGEYTLNYAKEIAAEVRQMVRKSAAGAAVALVEAAAARFAAEEEQLRKELAELEERLAHRRELERLEAAELASVQALTAGLTAAEKFSREPATFPDPTLLQAEPEEEAPRQPSLRLPHNGAPALPPIGGAARQTEARPHGGTRSFRTRLAAAAETLDAASRVVEPIAPLAGAARTLQEKSRRMREQRFTAALFGAFSAGKSSFANALLGESALPVSPNPTTASINTVVPPEEPDWPHGTARVWMKPKESIMQDIEHSIKTLGLEPPPQGKTIEFVHRAIAKQAKEAGASDSAIASIPPGAKPHLAFLRAVTEGWAEAESLLGTTVRADGEQFRAFVAEERKSAFVDRIELFYESPLSKQGVTLVDTPGADSINARHTGIAFNYIKNADAIFFVTYYNHAFSRADRQFLEQLGRVKDAFELDKMFFIVNAADLASSAEELEDVLNHVRDNLTAFGIRNPRLFPVSSLAALRAKSKGSLQELDSSGMAAFEEAFRHFAGEELAGLAFRSAEGELQRANGLLRSLIEAAQTGEEQRSASLANLAEDERAARGTIAGGSVDSEQKAAAKEIAEQFYYMKQRITYRFGEWFAASFNPSSLREDRGDVKQSLEWAWRDLTDYIRKELTNESLAVSVRMERFLNLTLAKTYERRCAEIRKLIPGFVPDPWEPLEFETPPADDMWAGEEPDVKLLKSHYKNAKQFFEGDGRKQLREALEQRWQQNIAQALDSQSNRFAKWYEESLRQADRTLAERAEYVLSEAVSGIRSALDQTWDVADLESRGNRLQEMLQTFERME